MEYFLSTDQVRQIMKYTIHYLIISAEQWETHSRLGRLGLSERMFNSKWKESEGLTKSVAFE